MKNLADLISRAEHFVRLAEDVLRSVRGSEGLVDTAKFLEVKTGALSFVASTFGENHPYFQQIGVAMQYSTRTDAQAGLGILRAIENEIKGGWLATTRSLISAEIFTDFLEMAQYLLSEGYKDAAAVMTGSVLEEHLRQLCQANSIDTEIVKPNETVPKKADQMNADLAKAGVYSKLDLKSVTTWLDLRNKAAHGKYSEYTQEQVNLMHQGITNFIARVPA